MFTITLGIFMMVIGVALFRLFDDTGRSWVIPTVRILVFGGSAVTTIGVILSIFHLTVG